MQQSFLTFTKKAKYSPQLSTLSSLSIGSGAILASIIANSANAQNNAADYRLVQNADFKIVDGNLLLTRESGTFQISQGSYQVIDGQLYLANSAYAAIETAAIAAPAAAASGAVSLPVIAGAVVLGGAGVAALASSGGSSSSGSSSPSTPNNAPIVATPISDSNITTDSSYTFQVPANTFADADSDTLTYSASLADDSDLPDWLDFNASTQTLSGTPPSSEADKNLDIKITANDGRGGTVSDTFTISIADLASVVPTISNTKVDHSEAENGRAGDIIFTADGEYITSWTLEGEDAAKFTIDDQGNVKLIATTYDFEMAGDSNGDNTYSITVKGTAANGRTVTKDFSIDLTDVTELPSFITTNSYVSTHDGVNAILSNDDGQAHWARLGATNTSVTLTYSFQTIGAEIAPDGSSNTVTLTQEYTDSEKAYIRSVFAEFSSFANINFREVFSNRDVSFGGADIRISKGTSDELGVDSGVLGFAYQPNGSRFQDYVGNFFLNSSALGEEQDFSNPYGDERNTISHELGHAIGLDHPFNDNVSGSGFRPYDSTSSQGPNRVGSTSGGSHDTPLADELVETIMTYYNGYASNYVNETRVTPWQPGTIDIAALQHLYGANLTTNADDSTYAYSEDSAIFETIWDGGGTDIITHSGTNASIINLNDGEFSHIGKTPGSSWTYDVTQFGGGANSTFLLVNVAEARDGNVVISDDRKSFTFTQNMEIGGIDGEFTINYSIGGVPGSFTQSVDSYITDTDGSNNPHTLYNIGIAHGVTIENATGGDGVDTIIGNEANNIIIGNAGDDILSGNGGNDTLTGGSGDDKYVYRNDANQLTTGYFGNDTITDFTSGQDVIQIQNSIPESDVSFANGVLTLGEYGTVTLDSVTSLTAGTDYVFVS